MQQGQQLLPKLLAAKRRNGEPQHQATPLAHDTALLCAAFSSARRAAGCGRLRTAAASVLPEGVGVAAAPEACLTQAAPTVLQAVRGQGLGDATLAAAQFHILVSHVHQDG